MTRIDDLLREERLRADASGVVPPPFEQVRARGLRRRRRQRAAVAVGAVVTVAAAAVGGPLLDQLSTGPAELAGPRPVDAPVSPSPRTSTPPASSAPPAPTMTSAPSAPDATDAGDSLADPAYELRDVVVAPGAPRARVATWQHCSDGECGDRWVLAVTGDGFRTRSTVEVSVPTTPVVTAVSAHTFHVHLEDGAHELLRTDGSTIPIREQAGAYPLQDGEVLVRDPDFRGFLGLDPDSGAAHPVQVPGEVTQLVAQPDGTLHGSFWADEGSTTVWSHDGGRTWRSRVLSTDRSAMLQVLPSAQEGVLAVLEGADGATLFPLLKVHRSRDGGATWQSFDLRGDPQAYGGGAGVLPDGRLLVDVDGWSDDRRGAPGRNPQGLYVTAGGDWSRIEPVRGGEAPGLPKGMLTSGRQVRVAAAADGLVLTAVTSGDDAVEISTDAGGTWRRVAAR